MIAATPLAHLAPPDTVRRVTVAPVEEPLVSTPDELPPLILTGDDETDEALALFRTIANAAGSTDQTIYKIHREALRDERDRADAAEAERLGYPTVDEYRQARATAPTEPQVPPYEAPQIDPYDETGVDPYDETRLAPVEPDPAEDEQEDE
jgi:hypothetical protein